MRLQAAWRRIDFGPGERIAWAVTAALVVIFAVAFAQEIVQADDAFISYRYSLNLATGHGLVFNQGEYVEGYTNLLWVLLVAAFIRLGIHAPSAAQGMSVFFGALSLIMLHAYVRRFLPRRFAWLAAAAPLVMWASNGFACWMSAGLETPLFLCLTLAALLAFDRERPVWVALICGLAFLCRPEGGIEASVLLGVPWLLAVARGEHSARSVLRVSTAPLIFAAFAVGLTVFRLIYYGDIVPNTFHAKVGQIPMVIGWIYVQKFLGDGPLLLLPACLLAAFAAPRLRLPLLFAIVTAAYCISIGGDVFAYGRFLLPVLPVLLAGGAFGAGWIMERQIVAGAVMALMLPAAALVSLYGHVSPPDYYFSSDYDWGGYTPLPFPLSGKRATAERHYVAVPQEKAVSIESGRLIRQIRPGPWLVACIAIGKMGYYNMDLSLLDMVGLIDRHIAQSDRVIPNTSILPGHSRTDSDYVLARKPDIIMLPNTTDLHPGMLPAAADLLGNPKLTQEYTFRPDGPFWVRK